MLRSNYESVYNQYRFLILNIYYKTILTERADNSLAYWIASVASK